MSSATQVRLGVLAAAALWPFVVEAPELLRLGVQVAALVLIGLALTVTVGWMRTLALHAPMGAALGALTCAAVLGRGQGLPLAIVAAVVIGALAGAVPVLPVLSDPRRGLPITSVLATFAVWALVLPNFRPSGFARPVLIGVDLAGERPLYLAVLVLVAGAWTMLDNLDRADLGRRLRVLGADPALLARSGVDVPTLWVLGSALSGVLAALGGVILALSWQGVPDPSMFSPAFAVVVLVIPLLAATRHTAGVLVGALLLAVAPRLTAMPNPRMLLGAGLVALLALAGGQGLPVVVRWWRST